MNESDYEAIISYARYLRDIEGYDLDALFAYLESPHKWETERELWLERQREPRSFDGALADSLRGGQILAEARLSK